MNRQRGGAIGAILKLLVMIILAFLLSRTNAHLDKKYTAPPSQVVQPAVPPTNKVK